MTRRTLVIGAIVLGLATGACGCSREVTAGAPDNTAPAQPVGPLLLAQFQHGVGAVVEGSSDPVWTEPDAVAAPDGSAVFSIRATDATALVRLDPRTGASLSSWPVNAGLSISAVAPAGRWVALTAHAGDSTEIVVFDPDAGAATHHVSLTGDVRPEAFSVDGQFVFALDFRGDHYRVQTIELATGDRYDTSDRDKTIVPEDMNGAAVRGVLSADRTLLATLYRNPGDAGEPAFVHVLDLEKGWSYCADLPPPFGTGPAGSDAIALSPFNTVIVSTANASRVAEIHIDDVHIPGGPPVTVEYRDEPAVRTAAVSPTSVPGFVHTIAVLPA